MKETKEFDTFLSCFHSQNKSHVVKSLLSSSLVKHKQQGVAGAALNGARVFKTKLMMVKVLKRIQVIKNGDDNKNFRAPRW